MSERISAKTFLILGLGVLAALVLRLFHLDLQTFTHPEFYVPALDVADFVSSPRARFTIPEVLYESLINDKHPPGYYILMLGWNLSFGTEVFQIRLSSVLFGMVGILATVWYVRVSGSAGFGALAVWLLGTHGFHIFWSQQARPWVLVGTMGIVSTAVLISLVRRPRVAAMIGYGLAAGFGMWIDYYFWPFFCAQVLWVVLHELDRERLTLAVSGVALAAIIATPMVTYFWLHLTEQPSHLTTAGWQDVLRLVQFGGIVSRGRFEAALHGFSMPVEVLVTVVGASALALGLRPWKGFLRERAQAPPERSRWVFAILALAAVGTTAWTWSALHGMAGDRKIFWVALLGPFAVLVGWIVFRPLWPVVAPAVVRLGPVRGVRRVLADPVTVVPLAAFAAVMAVSTVKPLLAEYAMVGFTPFMVVIAARGIGRMGRWRMPVGAIVFVVFAFSIWQYRTRPFSPIEYKGLGLQLREVVTPGQAIIMRTDWATQPINYYLAPDRYRVIPISHLPDAAPPLGVELPDTVWLVAVGDDDAMIEERQEFLRRFVPGFAVGRRISTGTSGALQVIRVDSARVTGGGDSGPGPR